MCACEYVSTCSDIIISIYYITIIGGCTSSSKNKTKPGTYSYLGKDK